MKFVKDRSVDIRIKFTEMQGGTEASKDGQTESRSENSRKDGESDNRTDGHKDSQIDGQTALQTDKRTDRRIRRCARKHLSRKVDFCKQASTTSLHSDASAAKNDNQAASEED